MAKSRKTLREEVKEKYVLSFMETLSKTEDVLRVGSNEIAFPVIDSEGNEDYIVLTIKIPTGANKGTEPYDGYAMADEYELRLKTKAEAKKKSEELKQKKIAKDEEYRRKKKEQEEKKAEKVGE